MSKVFHHKNLEINIGYKFRDRNLLLDAIKKNNKNDQSKNSFERLEFLGDRVLGFVISKRLLEKYPDDREGSLDKKLASLVNRKKCLEVAKSINLDKFIFVGNSKRKIIKIEDKIISDTCESLIGAIYLDKGIDITEKFILNFWKDHILSSDKTYVDSKTKLQEYSLKKFKSLPVYKFISNTGLKHKPKFKISVKLKNTKFYEGIGDSKKKAEQNAAEMLLKILNL